MTAGIISNLCPHTLSANIYSLTHGDYTFAGGVKGVGGGQIVYRINHSTRKVDQIRYLRGTYPKDTHMTPSIELMPDGRLGAVATGHGEDGVVRFWKSSDLSPLRFGSPITALSLTDTTYAHLFVHGANAFAIVREAGGKSDGGWDIAKSSDNGATWTRKKRLFRGTTAGGGTELFYMRWQARPQADGTLLAMCSAHEDNAQNKISILSLNLATGTVTTSNGAVGTIEDGTNDTPLDDLDDMQAIRTPAADRSQSPAAINLAGTRMVIKEQDTDDGANITTYMARRSSGNPCLAASWDIVETNISGFIKFVESDPTGNTVMRVQFVDPNYNVDLWTSADDGETFTKGANLYSSTTAPVRFTMPRNAGETIPFIIGEGTEDSFSSWTMSSKWVAA